MILYRTALIAVTLISASLTSYANDNILPARKDGGGVIFGVERTYFYRGFPRSNDHNSADITAYYQTSGFFKIEGVAKMVDFPFDDTTVTGAEYELMSTVGFDFNFPLSFVRFDIGAQSYTYVGADEVLQKEYNYYDHYALLQLGTKRYNFTMATFQSPDYFRSIGPSRYDILGISVNVALGLDFYLTGSRFYLIEEDAVFSYARDSSEGDIRQYDSYEMGFYLGVPEFNVIVSYLKAGINEDRCPLYNACGDEFNFRVSIGLY